MLSYIFYWVQMLFLSLSHFDSGNLSMLHEKHLYVPNIEVKLFTQLIQSFNFFYIKIILFIYVVSFLRPCSYSIWKRQSWIAFAQCSYRQHIIALQLPTFILHKLSHSRNIIVMNMTSSKRIDIKLHLKILNLQMGNCECFFLFVGVGAVQFAK